MAVNKKQVRPPQITSLTHEYKGNKVELERGKKVDSYTIKIESIDSVLTDQLCRVIAGALSQFEESIGKAENKAIENVAKAKEKEDSKKEDE